MSADPISRLNAALEGRYRVEGEVGRGGMATVYRADDLKHERKVALKVLKPELAAVVGAERFLAEIKTTANLQHSHILPLYDSGEADGLLFYVMPYVEGESLRERLDREHQLPVDEAVQISTNVAEALDYAHGHGVVHRDIKPENILLQAGKPMISDFGIALALSAGGGDRLTETGLSLGTPYYMSPEQATGDAHVGPATDVYALGCVLYEMLAGEPPFTGATPQAVLGRIIMGEAPSATEERSSVPANVDAAIRKALEKLPADRFGTAGNFAHALKAPGFRHGVWVTTAEPRKWRTTTVGIVALTLGAALWGWLGPEPPPPPSQVLRYSLALPAGGGLHRTSERRVAVSPDGERLVYVGSSDDIERAPRLYVRARDQLRGVPLGPVGEVGSPAFSPDGSRVAYFSFSPVALNIVSLSGDPPVAVANSGMDPGGISWASDGYLYGDARRTGEGAPSDGIVRIPAGGGALERVTIPDTTRREFYHKDPDVLPNNRGVIFTVSYSFDRTQDEIAVADLATGEHEVLMSGVRARYARSGHLVYVTADGTLHATPFDQESLALVGDRRAIVQGVRVPGDGGIDLVVTDTGTLMYSIGDVTGGINEHELVWLSRGGEATRVDPGWTFDPGDVNFGFALSPDGRRVALRAITDYGADVWVKELPDGPFSRLSLHEAQDGKPGWSSDGEYVTFLSSRGGNPDVWTKRADGTGEEQLVYDHEVGLARGFLSPDEEWLLMRTIGRSGIEGGRDILVLRSGTDDEASPLLASEFDEWSPVLSGDGRWIAYESTESGQFEVFVRPFPEVEAGRIQVSTEGGFAPLWSHSGTELFYWTPDDELVAVDIETDGILRAGERQILFDLSGRGYRVPGVAGQYDITADDQQFLLMMRAPDDEVDSVSELIVVENFFEVLNERVGN